MPHNNAQSLQGQTNTILTLDFTEEDLATFFDIAQKLEAKFGNEFAFTVFDLFEATNYVRELFSNLTKGRMSSSENSALGRKTQLFNFTQLALYKVLPCPRGVKCPCNPREVATKNQYNDKEYHCPFYHHLKDRRRIVLNDYINQEFLYKANYFDNKSNAGPETFSQNYFESMFHPLYYKMFECKRIYCKHSNLCPFFHSNEEKTCWSENFSKFLGRDRVNFVKDKKKYYEVKSDDEKEVEVKSYIPFSSVQPSTTFQAPQYFNFSANQTSKSSGNSGNGSPVNQKITLFADLEYSEFVPQNIDFSYVMKSEEKKADKYEVFGDYSRVWRNMIREMLEA